MKKLALLLVAALVVTLISVSCSKKSADPTPKEFSMSTNFELNFNVGTFSGSFTNPDNLTALSLMLKKDTLEYERFNIQFNNKGFTLTIDTLSYDRYSYYYEYVNNGVSKQTDEMAFQVLVGRWSTADGGHFEVYNADGTGKMWDPADDVQEDEADTFDWSIDENNKMTQIVHYQGGQGEVPQYCNIHTLNTANFKYDNEGWRATYELIRVQ